MIPKVSNWDINYKFQSTNIHHCCLLIAFLCFVTKDDITGDGTTSNVLIIGELLKQVQCNLVKSVGQALADVLWLIISRKHFGENASLK